MLRDFKFLRRNSGKNEEMENVPVNQKDSTLTRTNSDTSRAPLNSIQEPTLNPRPDLEVGARSKIERTPTKAKGKSLDPPLPLRTPDRYGAGLSVRNRFGWNQKNEPGSVADNQKNEPDLGSYSTQVSRGGAYGTGSISNVATPRTNRTVGRAASSYSESNSTQSTPTKSVTKPLNSGFRNRLDGNVGFRTGNFTALYKGIPINSGTPSIVNSVEVPHFDLKEDLSFWMEHNVQVLIRIRPLNSMECSTQGYNRCLKQESAQSITWIGQPETRFTFDHVACETVDQEMLFRMACLPMVENCLSGYNSCMFAYGQTGSGKTYTMLGEIEDLEVKPSPHRGMTPRIFEFLFARIQAEEESRRDEKLKYNCKCSFLEIYNEQITDLLDPSSTNLLLREDVKKGVYVENLSEFEVQTVSDILKLLTQGSLNRKVAATNMNRESSRSHSVFTCVIESRWEKDSATNLRFARLNLVDLAGSERQKTSGAEGERLKEAANINKSLSTLGHVIMVLLDVAHGKQKHIPYRDSRLTFLLQDSLGGNSKTMIIANVSPSICCAAETLNTLKFAQRAKLIQNNAVVNEDSTGDIIALQHQIRLLKEELSILKRQNISRSLSFGLTTIKDSTQHHENSCTETIYHTDNQQADDLTVYEPKEIVRMSTKQLKSLETTLTGALRREQMAEANIKQLEAEIEQLNRLVRQREEDTRCTKMMLRFREDKIRRMETLVSGSMPAENYLVEENRALLEEIQLLQAKLDRNPEVTRFAWENIRLLEQLRRYQEFYGEGEREVLSTEVSELRDQLLQFLGGSYESHNHSKFVEQPELKHTLDELEECKCSLESCLEENENLRRKIDNLCSTLNGFSSGENDQDGSNKTRKVLNAVQNEVGEHEALNPEEEIVNLQLELDIIKIILKEERSSHGSLEEKVLSLNRDLELATEELGLISKQYEEAKCELKEAKSIIEALESQQVSSIDEIEELRSSNGHYMELLSKREGEIKILKERLSLKNLRDLSSPNQEFDNSPLREKLKRMHDSLEKAKRMNTWYQSDRDFQESSEQEMDEVRRQVEAETAEVIVCMQEELVVLQQQVQDGQSKETEMKEELILLESRLKEVEEKLRLMTNDNERLCRTLEKKDVELRTLSEECNILASEMEETLGDGCLALMDVSDQLYTISSSFPEKRIWISEQVNKMAKVICEKEILINDLRRCLEDAHRKRTDMETMLKSLRGAALVIAEAHQQESSEKDKEILQLTSQVSANASNIAKLENKIKLAEDQIGNASKCATVAFVIVNRLSEVNHHLVGALKHKVSELNESLMEESERQIEYLREQLAELENSCSKLSKELSEEQQRACSMEKTLEDVEQENIFKAREKLVELKTGVSTLRSCMTSYKENYSCPEENDSQKLHSSFSGNNEEQKAAEAYQENNSSLYHEQSRTNMCDSPHKAGKRECSYAYNEKGVEARKTCRNVCHKDITIVLLKKEIESALESLKEVQAEISKLHFEKKDMLIREKQSKESMQCLASQVLSIQAVMDNFDKHFQLKLEASNNRLKSFEDTLQEAGFCWSQAKELLEVEVGDAKINAAHKTAEASCILAKFEEAQDTMKEADIMINGLMIANETMKLDIEKLKKEKVKLVNDRDLLRNEVQSVQSVNDLQCHQLQALEEQLSSNLEETKNLVTELEAVIEDVQVTSKDNFVSLSNDIHSIKSLLLDSIKLVHSWLENIWSEIIVKDCAVSVLHLCHMGILLETVTGLNAENGFLQHGISESNSVVADLREHNLKSRKELDVCRLLKGKLLADIKNSFDRIQSKEEEAGELSLKLTDFEKKISNLQLQEQLMLRRSNYMASQLTVLMKELNSNNTGVVMASLLDQEKMLKDKEELIESQNDFFMIEWFLKDFESHILATEFKEMALQKADADGKNVTYLANLENLKKDVILLNFDSELREQLLSEKEDDIWLLQKEIQEAQLERQNLLSKLELSSTMMTEKDEVNMELEQKILLQKDVECSNEALRIELNEVIGMNVRLLSQVQALEAERGKVHKDLLMKEEALAFSSNQISSLNQKIEKLQQDICMLEKSSDKLQSFLVTRDEELCKMRMLEKENEMLEVEMKRLTTDNTTFLQHLEERKSDVLSSLARVHDFDQENQRLQDEVSSLEKQIAGLENDLELKNTGFLELQNSQSVIMKELCSKSQHLQSINILKQENAPVRNELWSHCKSKQVVLSNSSLNIVKCVDSEETVKGTGSRILGILSEGVIVLDRMSQEIFENVDQISKFVQEFECLECHAKDIVSENSALHAELSRKDEILKGLLFDLSLLQESASNTKDQKDEIEEIMASLEALDHELAMKSGQLDEAIAHNHSLELQLKEKINLISALELDISKERESLKFLSGENMELRAHIDNTLAAKCSIEQELVERKKMSEEMEMELLELHSALGELNYRTESLRSNLNDCVTERDNLQAEVLSLKEKLETSEARAEESEGNLMEAQQIAELRKTYAEEKEAEVKLLERSVEELECTINVLENKVDIVKEEAERQRLQREELELELHAVKQHMQNFKDADADMKRYLDEKVRELQESSKHIKVLEQDIADKSAEIVQLKAHISELSLYADAQANEYKQKFKALENMAEQVRPEGHSTYVINSLSNKPEKHAVKSRGSGSPFKCIGLGITHQIKSEKDEELAAASLHIEELETLAVSRQKEIFTLNARLAAAESMTHDVIRDLLGVKLDMTTYVSLLDNQQVQKITEKARLNGLESQEKEQEVIKLKKQLNDFIEERRGWLEEIDQQQAELVATEVTLEKLRQRDQLLKTENEMLKVENVNYKKKMTELEGEVKKLSGQQNLQQRIHHHAKIKDENNMLRIQNGDLTAKLRHTEILFARVKEELAHFRPSVGKTSYIDFDKEQQLSIKLKEAEEEKVHLAQKLLSLCTSVLKAAGTTKLVPNICPSAAEEALEQLMNRIASMERELHDLKFKNRVSNERIRLSELKPQSSPISSRTEDNCQSPKTTPKAQYFSVLDR